MTGYPQPDDGTPARPRLESLLDQRGRPSVRKRRVDLEDWAGGITQEQARMPAIRINRRWLNVLWLAPVGVAGLLVAIALAQQLRQYGWMQSFIETYPGTSKTYAPPVTSGFPAWLRWQHLFNIIFMMFIIRAGVQILADHPRLYLNSGCRPGTEWFRMRDPVPPDRMDQEDAAHMWTAKDDAVALPKWLGIPGVRHTIGLARWWHFSFDLLWLVNGFVFYILLFATGQWRRIVPRSWEVLPNALSTAVQYASLDFPSNEGFTNYNGMQIIAYFTTVFVAAPLAFLTGLLQAPAVAARFGFGRGVFNRQVARTAHFAILVWMVFFIFVHTVMVFTTGLVGNLNHIVLGTDTKSYWPLLIYIVAMVVIIGMWLSASPITLRYPGAVQIVGRWTVGWLKDILERLNPNATYSEKDISPYLWPNGTHRPPAITVVCKPTTGKTIHCVSRDSSRTRSRCLTTNFSTAQARKDYPALLHSGMVRRRQMGRRRHVGHPRDRASPASARWVVFYSFAEGAGGTAEGRYYDCHKIEHMQEPTCLLAYEMNGQPLNEAHGAPLRLRNEREIGFKQVKWIEAIEFVESFSHLGFGQGGYNEDHEFYGYRMPI